MKLLARKSLPGGVFLREDRGEASTTPIRTMPPPGRLRIPLSQHTLAPIEPCVEPGQPVEAGQVVGKPGASEKSRAFVHAPVAGTVVRLTQVDTPYRDAVPAVELECADSRPPLEPRSHGMLPDLACGHLADLARRAGIEFDDNLDLSWAAGLDYLIVNGLDPEPGQTVRLRCLLSQGAALAETAAWLAGILGVRRTVAATDTRYRRQLVPVRRSMRRAGIRSVALRNRYPQSHPTLLIHTLTGRQIPCSGSATDVRTAVIDARDLVALRMAVGAEQPLTNVTIGIAGEGLSRPEVYSVPLGMCVGHVAEAIGAPDTVRFIADGVLAGPAIHHREVVVTKRTSLLLMTRGPHERTRAPSGCIRCGACQDHCPVNLDPRALLDLVERRRFDQVGKYWPTACVECGVCDYVCPSSLPLMRSAQRSRQHVLDVS